MKTSSGVVRQQRITFILRLYENLIRSGAPTAHDVSIIGMVSITSLATFVHLSPRRFRHLWRLEMGMSVQSYLRWKRLMTALYTSACGASLTEAAHAADFADSAHLTRVFHATFGMQPSRICKNSHVVQIIPGAER